MRNRIATRKPYDPFTELWKHEFNDQQRATKWLNRYVKYHDAKASVVFLLVFCIIQIHMNTLLDQIRNFINVFCTNNDTYQLVKWDDGSFDVIESIYKGAIVYQFIGDGDAVIVKENGRTTVISSYDEFNQLFPYIFQ